MLTLGEIARKINIDPETFPDYGKGWECYGTTTTTNPDPSPTTKPDLGMNRGEGQCHGQSKEPPLTTAPEPAGTGILLRTVHGEPSSKSILEWDRLARQAKRRWLQGGRGSQAACVDLCYFSSVVKFLRTGAWCYEWVVSKMAYPPELAPLVNATKQFA